MARAPHCHSHGVIHRNLSHTIGDAIGHSFYVVGDTKHTETVTRAYQAPEVLLGSADYSTPVDVWAVGCIYVEMLTGKVVFNADVGDDVDAEEANKLQLHEIFRQLGRPTVDQWPGLDKLPGWKYWEGPKKKSRFYEEGALPQDLAAVDTHEWQDELISKMLTLYPNERITASDAPKHPYMRKYSGYQGYIKIR